MQSKWFQRKQFKKEEATGELISNKIADKITKVSKSSPQNNFESKTEIPKKDI